MREAVTITTEDGVRLAGHFYPVAPPASGGSAAGGKGWALLLHMMPATKESYASLATELQVRGIASLAIDFRGHGESDGGPKGYEQFSDAEHQAKIGDVVAARQWLLRQPEATDARLAIVGASIGANLAFQFITASPGAKVRAAVLLSPGLNYRGVEIESRAQGRLQSHQDVFLAAGGADDEYSTATVQRLAELLGDRATVQTFSNAGHGTAMLEREVGFLTTVADWIADRIA